MMWTGVLMFMAAAPVALPPDVHLTVPRQFQGEWNERLEHCGTGLNDSRLRIGSGTIRFYESGGKIKAAVTRGDLEVVLVAEMSGEGEAWLSTSHFVLDADGRYLVAKGADGSDYVRYRCPS